MNSSLPPKRKVPLWILWKILATADLIAYSAILFVCLFPLTYHFFVFDFAAASISDADLRVKGSVTSIGKFSDDPDSDLWEISYKYEVPGRPEMEWDSYVERPYPGFVLGQEVTICYLSAYPYVSKIEKLDHSPNQRSMIPVGFGIVALLSLGGFGFRFWDTYKKVSLIKSGIQTRGVLVERNKTDMDVNRKIVYQMSFEFEVDGKKYSHVLKTHKTKSLLDEKSELVLYNSRNPGRAIMVDQLEAEIATAVKELIRQHG